MPPPHLHVIGVDPGGTTGWCRLTIPRMSIYGDEPGAFLEVDHGELFGDEEEQVAQLCRLSRTVEGMDYPTGPALVVEDFDMPAHAPTTDGYVLLSPVRICAMLRYARRCNQLGQARLVVQPRTIAKSTMTDDRLRAAGLWFTGAGHDRDAARHALTAIKRAKRNPEFRSEMWNHA